MMFMHLRIWYSKIYARIHANQRGAGTLARGRERELNMFQEAHHCTTTTPPPRSHTICAITLRACVHLCVHTRTQVCIGRLPTFDRTIHFLHPAYYTHTGPRLNANTDPLPPPEFNQNSSAKKDQLVNLRRKLSILPWIRSLYSRPRKG